MQLWLWDSTLAWPSVPGVPGYLAAAPYGGGQTAGSSPQCSRASCWRAESRRPLPFSGSANVVVDAHLFGVLGRGRRPKGARLPL
jgi:hypothetical protein